jgi:hypothetical protein
MSQTDPDRLESWQEIADFAGCHWRTAMRWADERGMPVHRLPGKRSRVYASRAKIKEWMETQPKPESESESEITSPAQTSLLKRKWAWAGAAAVLAALILGLVLISSLRTILQPKLPTRVAFTENGFDVFDGTGHKLWTHSFPKRLDNSPPASNLPLTELVRFDDFRGDGDREVLVVAPLRNGPNAVDTLQVEVDCFSSRGELLWSYAPHGTFQFGDHTLEGPWKVLDVFVSEQAPRKTIWITAEHYTWGNSFVAQLDPETGRDTVRFVNTGVIYALNEIRTSRGNFLLAGGFNNEWDGGSLAVIDERKIFAASPQTPGTRHKCVSCPEGLPDYYFIFPRTEINEAERVYEDSLRIIRLNSEGMEIRTSELNKTDDAGTIYLFRTQPAIEPVSLRYDSAYDMLHRELSAQKKLNHSLEDCPERLHPKPVRMWTPTAGWTDLPLKPSKATD